jgi:uncharacterized protein YndB with AHSA1/START domain
MIKIEKSSLINRPVEDVWNFISNVENIPRWNRGTRNGKITSDGPVGVGSTIQYVRRLFGREMIVKLRVTAYEPHKTITLQLSVGRVTAQTGFTLKPVEDGTWLSHPSEITLGGLWKLITPVVTPMLEREGQEDIASIKRILDFPAQGGARAPHR